MGEWSANNCLHLNPSKCAFTCIAPTKKKAAACCGPIISTLNVSGSIIHSSLSIKILGVFSQQTCIGDNTLVACAVKCHKKSPCYAELVARKYAISSSILSTRHVSSRRRNTAYHCGHIAVVSKRGLIKFLREPSKSLLVVKQKIFRNNDIKIYGLA